MIKRVLLSASLLCAATIFAADTASTFSQFTAYEQIATKFQGLASEEQQDFVNACAEFDALREEVLAMTQKFAEKHPNFFAAVKGLTDADGVVVNYSIVPVMNAPEATAEIAAQ